MVVSNLAECSDARAGVASAGLSAGARVCSGDECSDGRERRPGGECAAGTSAAGTSAAAARERRPGGECAAGGGSEDAARTVENSKWPPSQKKAEKRTERAMMNIADKADRLDDGRWRPTPEEVKSAVKNCNAVCKGRDWINRIAPHTFILYGHKECDPEMLAKFQGDHPILDTPRVGVYPFQS